jgi:hypothetical protein
MTEPRVRDLVKLLRSEGAKLENRLAGTGDLD